MAEKITPFTKDQIETIIQQYPTPFHIYDEKAIRENARHLLKAFGWIKGFKEYFAVKANPNPHILKILHEEGFGTDCSSLPELILSEKAGITGEEIMFTSNNTPVEEFLKAKELGAVINFDDFSHIDYLDSHPSTKLRGTPSDKQSEDCSSVSGLPELVCFRYNPGPLRKGNAIIGSPEDAKYGFTKEQLFEGYRICKNKGVKRFGLHTMIASNELNPDYFIETADMLLELVQLISKELDIIFEFINIGGGIGIPYTPDQKAVDLEYISNGIKQVYEHRIIETGLPELRIVMENGRMITGPFGYLVTTTIHQKEIYKKYVGLDASMANLMRPGIYGAYHHISVMGKEDQPYDQKYDVTGSLCENNDKFAVNRKLPQIKKGDIVVIHDTGAHGFAMGFNYNGKLRSAELLLKEDGSVVEIRRAETMEDYFATLDFSTL